jgi:hypothetical protein
MTAEQTAHILVKLNATDPNHQRILVTRGEFYHPQLLKWLTLPAEWRKKAWAALARKKEDE